MTPCSGASASVVSASDRAPSTSPRAARTSPRTPSAARRCGSWSAWLGQLDALLRVPVGLVPAPREELRPAELGEDPGQRALFGTLLGLLPEGAEELAPMRELVNPGQHDAESEGRADRGLNGPRPPLELATMRERLPPFASARHRVDEAEHAEGGDLHRPVPRLPGEGDRRAGVVGGCGQVGPQQEEGTGEALLDAPPKHHVIPRVVTSLAVHVSCPATVSLVLLEEPKPVEDLAAPGPRRRGG